MMAKFEDLLGTTIAQIDGAEVNSYRVLFKLTNGKQFVMHHHQDCCENVDLNEIIGDISDLINSPILRAEEVVEYKSGTWTFYKLATIKGEVVLRWLGESNGYYSERVDFEEVQ